MAVPEKFIFTGHARKRLDERAITEAQFVEVVTTSNEKVKQYRGKNGGFVYLYSKSVNGKKWSIAAEVYKKKCFFITGFWNE